MSQTDANSTQLEVIKKEGNYASVSYTVQEGGGAVIFLTYKENKWVGVCGGQNTPTECLKNNGFPSSWYVN